MLRSFTMRNLSGTKTGRNLREAFAGESMAHTKYRYYYEKQSKLIKIDGDKSIEEVFDEITKVLG